MTRQRTIVNDTPDWARAELYDMVKQMMNDMNVEFELQVRSKLHEYLQVSTPAVPAPGPVDQQELTEPAPTTILVPSPPPTVPPAPAALTRPSAVPFSTPDPTPLAR